MAIVTYCLLFATQLRASHDFIPEMPTDLDRTEIYLITVDVGPELYMTFGHTVVRVKDPSSASDIVYNWGVFDFDVSGFLYKYLRGELDYKMEAYPYYYQLRTSKAQMRKTWQEKLQLTSSQKRKLIEKIIWQSQPENKYFRYEYFFKNCSTLPRDYLDEALNGAISKAFKNIQTNQSFRETTFDHLAVTPFAQMAVDVVFNSNTDIKMTVWQDMFKPASLRENLLTLPAFDDSGAAIADTKLLTDSEILAEFDTPGKPLLNGFQLVFFVMCVPVLLMVMLFIGTKNSYMSLRMLGFSSILWGMFSTFVSLMMLFFWFFSYQTDGYHNANLWVFWPFDFILLLVGWHWLRFKAPFEKISVLQKIIRYICLAHLVAILLFILLCWSGIISQDARNVLIYFVPLAAFIYWNIYWNGLRCGKRNEPC